MGCGAGEFRDVLLPGEERDVAGRASGGGGEVSDDKAGGRLCSVVAGWLANQRIVIARSLRRSDLAGFWGSIGHSATREMGFAAASRCHVAIAPRDDDPSPFGSSTHTSTASTSSA